MPKNDKGQKRPADVISNAVHVMRIATGEVDDVSSCEDKKLSKIRAGKAGAESRYQALTNEERSDIAKLAASVRWKKD